MSVEIDATKFDPLRDLREKVDYVNTAEEMDEIHAIIDEFAGPESYSVRNFASPVSLEEDIAKEGTVVERDLHHDPERFKYVLELTIEVKDEDLIE